VWRDPGTATAVELCLAHWPSISSAGQDGFLVKETLLWISRWNTFLSLFNLI